MYTNNLRFVEPSFSDVAERKTALRDYVKKRRAVNENRDVKEAAAIQNFIKIFSVLEEEIQQTKGAGTRSNVFCYLSYSSEMPTDKLIETLQNRGCNLYCPKLENGEMLAVAYGEDFSLNRMGIREPIGSPATEPMDVVILPLLAADEHGNRLGYGGGYYDRFLQNQNQAKRVGLCYDFQIVREVPHTAADMPLDVCVTDRRILYPNRGNKNNV